MKLKPTDSDRKQISQFLKHGQVSQAGESQEGTGMAKGIQILKLISNQGTVSWFFNETISYPRESKV